MHDIALSAVALAASSTSLAALLVIAYQARTGPRYRRSAAAQRP